MKVKKSKTKDQEMKNYELTNCGDLYKYTYWGNLEYKEENKKILDNRNNIAGLNELTKRLDININILSLNLDHCEYYKCRNGRYFFITSPYGKIKDEIIKKLELHEDVKLYHESATTYSAIINNAIDFRKFKKTIEQLKCLKNKDGNKRDVG